MKKLVKSENFMACGKKENIKRFDEIKTLTSVSAMSIICWKHVGCLLYFSILCKKEPEFGNDRKWVLVIAWRG
jgi:hypothetical protein